MTLDLRKLLSRHGLLGVPEQPMQHSGFSGAQITRLTRHDGASFILKRSSMQRDWIMQATNDTACREAIAASLELPPDVRTPVIEAVHGDDGFALLMHDVSNWLLPEGPIDDESLTTILHHMAELHRSSPPGDFPWCEPRLRLTLLTPQTARIAAANGAPVADDITHGWKFFERHATPAALSLVRSLTADTTPLLRALGSLPPALLHGDLKLDNIALDPLRRIWLLDWAMTLVAPPAVELGWFLAINSRRLPCSLDDVLSRYAAAAVTPPHHRPQQDAMAVLCGLLLRGWRKALEAEEGEPDELRWWCERGTIASALLGLPG